NRILKITARIDLLLVFYDPLFGDALIVSLSSDHEDQRPRRMALAFLAVARGLAAGGVVEDQGTREEVVRDRELPDECKLAPTQTRGERAFGGDLHLVCIFTQET